MAEFKELHEVIHNLSILIKSQDQQIKEMKMRLEKLEDSKMGDLIDLNKLNHNVNTQLDLELLEKASIPESKPWLGAGHYDTILNSLPNFKAFYEHEDWKLLSNVGFTQIYTKKEEEEKNFNILGRTELNHKIQDIGEEIYKQNIFINEDPNIILHENLQNVGEGIDVHYIQFNKFCVSERSDAVFVSQKIQYEDQSGIETIVFPIVSVKNFKKKPTDEFDRINFSLGGWVLKALGTNKTLVNLFFN